MPDSNDGKTWACEACGREFGSEEELDDHLCGEGQVY